MNSFAPRVIAVCIAGFAAVAAPPVARADSGPVFVVPSRPGVPTVIAFRNANWAIVEGDWGLARPGHMSPTVIGGTPLSYGRVVPRQGIYHPRYGRAPQRGRYEVEPSPDRVMPEPAESYSQSWGVQSEMQPIQVETRQQPEPLPYDPSIVVVPRSRR